MKGIILRGLREFSMSRLGREEWASVREEVGLKEESFLASHSYPDATAYRILGAIASRMSLELDPVLRHFGHHWMHVTGPQAYPQLFSLARRDPVGFLRRLSSLHCAATRHLDEANAPHISITQEGSSHVRLRYASKRGLPYLAYGLLEGLWASVAIPARVEPPAPVDGQDGVWTFRIHVHGEGESCS